MTNAQTLTDEQRKAILLVRKVQHLRRTEGYWFWENQDYQEGFDESCHPRVVIHGGNRSGKTMHTIRRILRIMCGEDPLNDLKGWEPPIYFRVCGAGMTEQVLKVLVEWFRKMTPRDWCPNGDFKFNTQTGMLRFAEEGPCKGGWVEFMSYDQDPEKGSGRPLHGVAFDEAYKCSERFRNQCLSRLLDYDGVAWTIETPEDGDATWSVKWYERAKDGDPDYAAFRYPTRKNKYLYPDNDPTQVSPAIEQLVKDCEGDEVQIRIRLDGDFVSIGGIVYKTLDPVKHRISAVDFGVDPTWTRYMAIDPGLNKDHAIVWYAVGPGNRVYFYRELYVSGTMEEMMLAARDVMGLETVVAVNFDRHWDWDNRTAKSKDGQMPVNLQRELQDAVEKLGFRGVPVIKSGNQSVWSGNDLVRSHLKQDEMTKLYGMGFSVECERVWDEMRQYSYVRVKEKEPTTHRPRIKKVADDGPDCVRIAVTSPMEYKAVSSLRLPQSEVLTGPYGLGF